MVNRHLSLRILPALLFLLTLLGCSPKQQEPIVARIGDEPLTLAEYERIYIKSNGSRDAGAAASLEDRGKFLDLVIKYRLKLKDAYRQGLDRTPETAQEIEQYKGSLARSFLTEREIVAPGVRKLYERRNEEIRMMHILLELSPTASKDDSAAAYTKAYGILADLKAGKDFGTLAAELSKDPSAKNNRGDLYFATGGDFIGPFEDAAYSMKPGELYPVPVRTRFGLHILKMLERQPASGEVRASHIMVRFPSMVPSPEETTKCFTKISVLADSLARGIDFAELAKRNSEDGGSATRGGDLGWFSRRRWVRPFDDSVMVLKVGQRSSIVRTNYGYHLILCTDKRPPKSFEEGKQELETLYQQRRFQDDLAAYMDKMKRDLAFARNDSVISKFLASVDSTKTLRDSGWAVAVTPELHKAAMMRLLTKPISVDSIVTIIESRPDLVTTVLRTNTMMPVFDKVVEQLLFAARADFLVKQNPDFAAVMNEYREGVLLYQIEQDRVWGKIAPSDTALEPFFQSHRDQFRYPDRVRYTDLRFATEAAAREGRARLQKGATYEQLVAEDSARMKLQRAFTLDFPPQSTTVNNVSRAAIAAIAEQVHNDASLSVRLTASPDTARDKARRMDLASRRIQTLKALLTGQYKLPESKIALTVNPLSVDTSITAQERAKRGNRVSADIVGRTPRILGTIETGLAAPASDDRARRADSVAVGELTPPFFFKNGYSVVRLDAREPARLKTFEEAGAEVSTAFQDYEAKRLEQEWIDGLRKVYPVVEERENLKRAFTTQQ